MDMNEPEVILLLHTALFKNGIAVTTMHYVAMDITNKDSVEKSSKKRLLMQSFTVQHGQL